jgi:hypothetical protein
LTLRQLCTSRNVYGKYHPLVHLRRALLLFAIVLGMAALAASLSRPIEGRRDHTTPAGQGEPGPPTATPRPGSGPVAGEPRTLTFQASQRQSKKLPAGAAATVEVEVTQAGQVEIPDMGLTSAADTVTPARFDVLERRPGRYPIEFVPSASAAEPARAGVLVVTSSG